MNFKIKQLYKCSFFFLMTTLIVSSCSRNEYPYSIKLALNTLHFCDQARIYYIAFDTKHFFPHPPTPSYDGLWNYKWEGETMITFGQSSRNAPVKIILDDNKEIYDGSKWNSNIGKIDTKFWYDNGIDKKGWWKIYSKNYIMTSASYNGSGVPNFLDTTYEYALVNEEEIIWSLPMPTFDF